MGLGESIFDLFYLVGVVSLGVMLLLEKDKSAKIFGTMAVLLGAGDAFHLVPRVMAHWYPDGFAHYAAALSWGQAITSVTMTVFYLLFFYYYRRQSGDKSQGKFYTIWALALARIALSVMPQNNWGTAEGDYTWAILRNIPFAIMGILLIIWSWQARQKKGMNNMALWIALSFLFYAPVVLWVNVVPALGALMIPKTIAYVMVVVTGYRAFASKFSAQSLLKYSFVSLILGLAGGVFFREFTKLFDYSANTFLGKIHVHTLVLGFIGFALAYLLTMALQKYDQKLIDKLKRPTRIWLAGLAMTVVFMWLHGIIEVTGGHYGSFPVAALSGLAGIGHIHLAVGLAWVMAIFVRSSRDSVRNA